MKAFMRNLRRTSAPAAPDDRRSSREVATAPNRSWYEHRAFSWLRAERKIQQAQAQARGTEQRPRKGVVPSSGPATALQGPPPQLTGREDERPPEALLARRRNQAETALRPPEILITPAADRGPEPSHGQHHRIEPTPSSTVSSFSSAALNPHGYMAYGSADEREDLMPPTESGRSSMDSAGSDPPDFLGFVPARGVTDSLAPALLFNMRVSPRASSSTQALSMHSSAPSLFGERVGLLDPSSESLVSRHSDWLELPLLGSMPSRESLLSEEHGEAAADFILYQMRPISPHLGFDEPQVMSVDLPPEVPAVVPSAAKKVREEQPSSSAVAQDALAAPKPTPIHRT